MELIESMPGSRGGALAEGKEDEDEERSQLGLEDGIDEASRTVYHETCLAAQEAIRVAQEQVSRCYQYQDYMSTHKN